MHIAIADLGDAADTVKMVEAAGRQAIAVKCDVASEAIRRRHGQGSRQEIRPRRHRHQLRRHLPAEEFRGHEVRRLAPGAVDQSRRRLPRHRRLRARHARAQMGPHRQHGVVDARLGGHRFRALRRQQRRHRRLHPRAGDRSRAVRHHRQRHRAGPDALARHAGARAAPGLHEHGRGIRRGRTDAGDQARGSAGGPGRHGVVSDQRRLPPSSPGRRSTSTAAACGRSAASAQQMHRVRRPQAERHETEPDQRQAGRTASRARRCR